MSSFCLPQVAAAPCAATSESVESVCARWRSTRFCARMGAWAAFRRLAAAVAPWLPGSVRAYPLLCLQARGVRPHSCAGGELHPCGCMWQLRWSAPCVQGPAAAAWFDARFLTCMHHLFCVCPHVQSLQQRQIQIPVFAAHLFFPVRCALGSQELFTTPCTLHIRTSQYAGSTEFCLLMICGYFLKPFCDRTHQTCHM